MVFYGVEMLEIVLSKPMIIYSYMQALSMSARHFRRYVWDRTVNGMIMNRVDEFDAFTFFPTSVPLP